MDKTEEEATVEDWIRGYMHTYLPEGEETEVLVQNALERFPGWVAGRRLTDTQRSVLEESFCGKSASLVQIIKAGLDGMDTPEGYAEAAAERWLKEDAPEEISAAVDPHTELPPVYVETLFYAVKREVRDYWRGD